MCPSVLVGVSLILSFVSAAVIVPLSTLPNGALRTPQTLPSILLPNNVTNTTTPPFNVLHYQCDDTHYGRNLNPSSCRNVFNYMRRSDVQSTFSERHTGRPNDIPLPIRFLSDDGLCFVQPLLKPGALTGRMSPTQLGQAAYTLLEKCVESRRSGGIAGTIGGDNNFNVVISKYAPRIRCDTTATPGPPWQSCLIVLSDMLATTERKLFGDKSRDSRVKVKLPQVFKAIDARCQVSVQISGMSTVASWYEIWEAVTALTAMCVRPHNKGGKAFGLGGQKNIFVQISDENPALNQPAEMVANISALTPFYGPEASNDSSEGGRSKWTTDPFIEVSTGLIQSSSSLSILSGDATSS